MSLRFMDILALAQFTLNNPRRGMRAVLDLDLPMGMRLAALALMAILSALLAHGSQHLLPAEGNPLVDLLLASPFQTALLQALGLLLSAGLIHAIGRAWGGRGQLDEAVMAVVWLQVFMVVLQLAEIAALALQVPQFAMMAAVFSIPVFLWLLSMFVAEVHGFEKPVKVFFGILGSIVALSFVLSFVLVGILGPEAFANV